MNDNPPLRVCEHCLWAIESREGAQYSRPVFYDEDDTRDFVCDWCGDDIHDTLYEI